MVKRFFSVLAALLFTAGGLATAQAALVEVGIPIEPHGYPAWYEDANGLQLELCLPDPAGNATREDLCLFDPLDTSEDEEGNFNHPLIVTGESFWWLAETSIDLPNNGDALLVLAIEATFGGPEAPIDGQQISFGRTRIRIDTPVAGIYTVTHPYATQEFEVTDPAEGINYTADIGAANFLSPEIGFRGTLAAPIGPFLTWPDYDTNPDLQVFATDPETGESTEEVIEQYIGNPNIASPVVGGPNGNIFRIDGPEGSNLDGQGNNFVETDLFFVMGKKFDPATELIAHVFPNAPLKNLFDFGPVNRTAPFVEPTAGEVTGEDLEYSVGYPIWYQEALAVLNPETGEQVLDEVTGLPQLQGGIQLTLCTPGDAMCISDPIDPTDEAQTTIRTGGEGFWWSADARFDVPAGRALLVLGLEATFGGDESIIDGQQIAFGRVRIRVDTAEAGTYRVTHPYGQIIFEGVPADDSGINHTADIGIADPSDPDFAFIGALYSDIGPTFLKWTTFVDPASLEPEETYPEPLLVTPNVADPELNNYYVGNPGVEHQVVGSPFDTNFFRVEILNGEEWELVGETDLFAVSGKIYDPATFEFAINPEAPVATDDSATLNIAQADFVTIDVLTNDTFADGAPVEITVLPVGEAFGPENGVAEANPEGTVTYTPSAAFAAAGGIDTFGYNILDSTGLTSNTAVVTVTIVPVETITFAKARFDTRKLRLDLRGTSNFPGSALTIYPGTEAVGDPLGTVAVDDRGSWRFRGTATTNMTDVTLVSNSADATTVTQPLQVR